MIVSLINALVLAKFSLGAVLPPETAVTEWSTNLDFGIADVACSCTSQDLDPSQFEGTFTPRNRAFAVDEAALSSFVSSQASHSLNHVLANIDHETGAITAAQSKENPNYFYHWVRDAALTMNAVLDQYELALQRNDTANSTKFEAMMWRYAAHENALQGLDNPSGLGFYTGLGEPKFLINGSADFEAWGRPQNDGLALRAMTLSRFVNVFLDHGGDINKIFQNNLYRFGLPGTSAIKADLEYITRHWIDASFELWEEMYAQGHFYTRVAQRAALVAGSQVTVRLNDPLAGQYYMTQIVPPLHQAIQGDHWDNAKQYILESVGRNTRPGFKDSNLDAGVILAALHTRKVALDPSVFGPNDIGRFDSGELLLTALNHVGAMKNLYSINEVTVNAANLPMAAGTGRYIEDVYNGFNTSSQGNPWFLINHGYAELSYAVAEKWCLQGYIRLNNSIPLITALNWILQDGLIGMANEKSVLPQGLNYGGDQTCSANPEFFNTVIQTFIDAGNAHIRRVKTHLPTSSTGDVGYTVGSISEEFNRDTGLMQGAIELTWSHASFLTMEKQRVATLSAKCACI